MTVLTLITYITLFSALLWIDRRPPKVASEHELNHWGVSVNEAWSDLQVLTREFHPYNSRQNDDVRQFLLKRIRGILSDNGVGDFRSDEPADGNALYSGTVELIDDGGSTQGSNVTFAGNTGSNVTVGSCFCYFFYSTVGCKDPNLLLNYHRFTSKERTSFSTFMAKSQRRSFLLCSSVHTTTVSPPAMVCPQKLILFF